VRQRVILPGFGNLEVKLPQVAEAPSGSRINPPGLSVRFDSGYSKDDGELAEKLAEGEGLELEEARQQVLELVDAIKFSLDKGEDFQIPEAGTLSRDADGKVHFIADPDWVLAPDLYGLESMELLELEDLSEEETPGEEPSVQAQSTTPPDIPGAPKYKSRRRRVVWLVALGLIVVLAVIIIIPSDKEKNGIDLRRFFNRKPDSTVVEQMTTDSAQQGSETETQVLETEIDTQVTEPETEAVLAEPDREQPISLEQTNRFFIIAGSFKKLRNASDLQDKLNERGFQAEVLITENRMYRVSVASYSTKEEAEKGLKQISLEPGLNACWLLSN
jgi:cell division septation protein DedD